MLPQHIIAICQQLRDDPAFAFDNVMDVCGVDYLHYGYSEWETESSNYHRILSVVSIEQDRE